MTQKDSKTPIAIVYFDDPGKGDQEEMRTYDFRNHEARHAYLRFTSWALANNVEFSVEPGEITRLLAR